MFAATRLVVRLLSGLLALPHSAASKPRFGAAPARRDYSR